MDRQACLDFAEGHTWEASARAFVVHLVTIDAVDSASDTVRVASRTPRVA
jgi:hypothetical protein